MVTNIIKYLLNIIFFMLEAIVMPPPSLKSSCSINHCKNHRQFSLCFKRYIAQAIGNIWEFLSLPLATKSWPFHIPLKHTSIPIIGLQPLNQPFLHVSKQINIILNTFFPYLIFSLFNSILHINLVSYLSISKYGSIIVKLPSISLINNFSALLYFDIVNFCKVFNLSNLKIRLLIYPLLKIINKES